jgi:hypothetical protein
VGKIEPGGGGRSNECLNSNSEVRFRSGSISEIFQMCFQFQKFGVFQKYFPLQKRGRLVAFQNTS